MRGTESRGSSLEGQGRGTKISLVCAQRSGMVLDTAVMKMADGWSMESRLESGLEVWANGSVKV